MKFLVLLCTLSVFVLAALTISAQQGEATDRVHHSRLPHGDPCGRQIPA